MPCVDENQLGGLSQGTLAGPEREAVLQHLAVCEACRRAVASAASGDDAGPAHPLGVVNPGQTVGRYQVLERIGRGGMGVVYAAYDPHLRRRVALKLLAHRLDGDELTERLAREAQAMAQLNHPNVVRVYDAGTAGDQFFIAMELVEGVSLRRWLEDTHPDWRLTLATLLAAGRGLASAHARGLVHRDFKPDNVLVGADGVARVTDFGLVRFAEDGPLLPPALTSPDPAASPDATLTHTGTVMGTAGYLAPEAFFEGRATAASDQFAFCATLYEALLGTLPFGGATLEARAANARAGRFQPPTTPPPIPRWLVEHLRRGLAGAPADRFPTMDALLAHLADDPAPKRRRRLLGVVASALTLTVAGATWHRHQTACEGLERELAPSWNAQLAARGQQAFQATGLPFAESSWRRVQSLLDDYARDWVQARVEACRASGWLGTEPAHLAQLRVACLQERRDELAAVTAALTTAGRPQVREAFATAVQLPPLRTCRDVTALANPGRQVPAERAPAVERSRRALAQARTTLLLGDSAGAEPAARAVYLEAVDGGPPALVAESALVLGAALDRLGKPEDLEVFERGLTAALAASEDELALRLLGRVIAERGFQRQQPAEAQALLPLAAGLVARARDTDEGPALVLEAEADVAWQSGQLERAAALYRAALARLQPTPATRSLDVARVHGALGWTLVDQGLLREAQPELDQARAMLEALVGPDHPALHETWKSLAMLAEAKGDSAGALAARQRAIDLLVSEAGPDSPRLASPLLNQAGTYAALQREAEATACIDRAERLLDPRSAEVGPRVFVLQRRSVLESMMDRPGPALDYAQRAVQLAEAGGATDLEYRVSLAQLLECQLDANRPADALATAQKAVRSSPGEYTTQAAEGRALARLGRCDEALARLGAALASWPPEVDPSDRGLALLARADCEWGLGRRALALEAAGLAEPLLASSPRARHQALLRTWKERR